MPIDVPYSLLVRDGDYAWSCGQLALDADSKVLAPDDLAEQSRIVAAYIAEVLDRGDVNPASRKRLLCYYVPATDPLNDLERVAAMKSAFHSALGAEVLVDAIPVPHFYYDGIVLEVDAFSAPLIDDHLDWVSVETPLDELPNTLDRLDASTLLSASWSVPEAHLADVSQELKRRGLAPDGGAVLSNGPNATTVSGSLIHVVGGSVVATSSTENTVFLTSSQSRGIGCISARCTAGTRGLVEQTELIMEAIGSALLETNLDFSAVVKSTTLYVGEPTAVDLHSNMEVRNRRYQRPGPASTGLPVFGFADSASRLTVSVTYTHSPHPN